MMTEEESLTYAIPAIKALYPDVITNHGMLTAYERLFTELNLRADYENYAGRTSNKDWPMSDELKSLLIKLAGPYGKAVLAAFKASDLPIKIY